MKKKMFLATLVAVALMLSGCASCPVSATPDPVSLQTQYLSAVADARTASPSKIFRHLTPINDDNPDLIWENGVKGSRLLVVTWLGDGGKAYKCDEPAGCSGNDVCKEGGECPNYSDDTWVTVVPEMRLFFAGNQPNPLRIAQLLGLPPESVSEGSPNEYKYMLELWVSPKNLFRPCPDTEVSDTVCETGFPIDSFRVPDLTNKVMATVGPESGVFMPYPLWFANHARHTYAVGSDPYPWTRLGYTYDWGSSHHVGLSEFVIHARRVDKSGISVGIKSVKTTAEYFTH